MAMTEQNINDKIEVEASIKIEQEGSQWVCNNVLVTLLKVLYNLKRKYQYNFRSASINYL